MIHAILVIGKPGCGKSIMVWYLGALLDQDGYSISYLSDRLMLEEGVLVDTRRSKRLADGSKVGKHSKLISDGPPGHRKVHVLDGTILNRVHIAMIQRTARNPHDAIILAEYAIGPVINFGTGKEVLRQSGHDLVRLLQLFHATDCVFVLDVEAPMAVRELREAMRPDAMAPETFRSYFPDGGEMKASDAKKLGSNYYRYVNNDDDHDGYYSEVRFLYETRIRPNLVRGGERKT